MNIELFNALMKWDRWGGEYKKELYKNFSTHKDFVTDTVQIFITQPLLRFQTGWLLRQWCEQKNPIKDELLAKIFEKNNELKHWWTKSSILRIITLALKNKNRVKQVEPFVRSNIKSKKIAIKALSIEAFGALALLDTDLYEEALKICQDGKASDSASIFVKSRNALKKLKKT